MERFDVVVVGGGVIGSVTAWSLARRGRSVLLVERFEAGHVNGSSHGTERIFRLTHADPFWSRLCVQALPMWHELEADVGDTLLATCGHLDLNQPGLLESKAAAAAEAGVATTWMSPSEVSERWPGLAVTRPALFHAEGARTHAATTISGAQRRVVELGGHVRHTTPVRSIVQVADGVDVNTDDETVHAAVVVVAAAGWTPDLLAFLPAMPPITTTKGQVSFFQPLDAGLRWPTFLDEEVYGMSTPDGRVRVGHHLHSDPVHPDARTFEPTAHTTALTRAWATEHLPGVDPASTGEMTCIFGESENDDFVIDRVGDIVVACGFGGHGFKFAPLAGAMIADIACGAEQREPRFRLSR